MSGGSFDYLCFQDPPNLDTVREMGAYLRERGFKDAADRTEQAIRGYERLPEIKAEMHDVWYAAEWLRSGDYGPERLEEVVNDWRAKAKAPASPEAKAAARRELAAAWTEMIAVRNACFDMRYREPGDPVGALPWETAALNEASERFDAAAKALRALYEPEVEP